MKISAEVISNAEIIKELERPHVRMITGSRIMWLRCPEIAKEARPGQFVMLRCEGECTLPRPFSIHQAKGENIALFYAVYQGGAGTEWLSQRKIDETVEIFGPLGKGFSIMPEAKRLLLVAGGMGLAPLIFLAQEALKTGQPVTLLYGTANNQRYPWRLLPSGIDLIDITEDGSAGKKGKATEFIPQFIHFADRSSPAGRCRCTAI